MLWSRAVLAGSALLAACSRPRAGGGPAENQLTIETPYASAQEGAEEAAVYFTIRNPAGRPDTLMHVNTAEAAGVSVHRSATSGGLVTMERLDWLAVGAGDSVVLAPGGTHLMLTGLKGKAPGDTIHLSLSFVHAGNRVISAPVYAPGDAPEHQHQVP
jgi:copper(I)-binding protein